MLKGSVLFFTYLITIFYLKRSLSVIKHISMVAILGSLTLIGYSNVSQTETSKCKCNDIQLSQIHSSAIYLLFFHSFCSALCSYTSKKY